MFSSIGYVICIPFAWLVRVFYELTGSYGVAIILFTLVLKLILLPLQMKSKKSGCPAGCRRFRRSTPTTRRK